LRNVTEDWSNDADSSLSHDPSEITLIWWFDAQEIFIIISVKKKPLHCFIFLVESIQFIQFSINPLMTDFLICPAIMRVCVCVCVYKHRGDSVYASGLSTEE